MGADPPGMIPLRILGVGHPFRRDDGVGPWVAAQLAVRGWPADSHPGEGAGLMDAWDGCAAVVLVDALQSGAAPGTIHRFDAHHETLPAGLFRASSHLFGVAEAVEMARVLGRLPPILLIYGIEGGDFTAGEGLTPPVAAAAVATLEQVEAECRRIGTAPRPPAAG